MTNIIEGIQQQCDRARAILPHYEELGPVGVFGATVIREAIKEGEAAIASDDVVRMVRAYKELEDLKE